MIKYGLSLVLIVMTTITAQVPDAAQFEKLRAAQRARALNLVSADSGLTTVGAVLDSLRKQTGQKLMTRVPTLDAKILLKARDIGLLNALHHLRLRLTPKGEVKEQRRTSRAIGFVPGAMLTLRQGILRKPSVADPTEQGAVVSIDVQRAGDGRVALESLALIQDERPVRIETCKAHSPSKVLALTRDRKGLTARAKGRTVWHCEVPVVIDDPKDDMSWEIGGARVALQWPTITLTRLVESSRWAFVDDPPQGPFSHVKVEWKPGTATNSVIKPEVDLDAIGLGGGAGRRNPTVLWCGCIDTFGTSPSDEGLRSELKNETAVLRLFGADADAPSLTNVKSITFTVEIPVVEPFDVKLERSDLER